jgi:Xaa-Pro aminopeptidase
MKLREGMVLAIEPMVNAGKPGVEVLKDGWTAVTEDGSMSAHFEHTVAVTADRSNGFDRVGFNFRSVGQQVDSMPGSPAEADTVCRRKTRLK